MTEVWTSNEKGNDKLIAFSGNTIYKANPRTEEETNDLAKGLKAGSFDTTKVWEIKVNHCNEIRLQDGKPYIELLWGKEGEEQLRITDEYKRYKIFEFIKSNISDAEISVDKWSIFRAGKKPMIAFFIVLGLFIWTMFYVIEAESGNTYYIESGRYDSITGIVLGLASMGRAKVVTIFTVLLGIAVISFIRKAKKPPVMNRIVIRK
jgi:hypothetical protein